MHQRIVVLLSAVIVALSVAVVLPGTLDGQPGGCVNGTGVTCTGTGVARVCTHMTFVSTMKRAYVINSISAACQCSATMPVNCTALGAGAGSIAFVASGCAGPGCDCLFGIRTTMYGTTVATCEISDADDGLPVELLDFGVESATDD